MPFSRSSEVDAGKNPRARMSGFDPLDHRLVRDPSDAFDVNWFEEVGLIRRFSRRMDVIFLNHPDYPFADSSAAS